MTELLLKTAPKPEEAPIDLELLHKIIGSQRALELVEFYLQDTVAELEKLKQAFMADDCYGLERLAHTLRGSSATCGMRAMVELLRELEELSHSGQHATVLQILERVEQEFS